MKPSFFEIEAGLDGKERKELLRFAQAPMLKASKKSIEILEWLTKVPDKINSTEKKILWLQRKSFPKDKDDRNFRRTCRQLEQLYFDYRFFLETRKGPRRLFSIVESLMDLPLDRQLTAKLKELEQAVEADDHEYSSNYLRHYIKENLRNQFLAKRQKLQEYRFEEALTYLDRFYLIEKLKYGISYMQVARVLQQDIPPSLKEEIELLSRRHAGQVEQVPLLKLYFKVYQIFLSKAAHEEEELLQLLNLHHKDLKQHARSDLHHLIANYLIGRITQVNQPLSALRKSYQNYYQYNRYLLQNDLLKERDYIPDRRFQNILGSALNVGTPESIAWAEAFLTTQLKHVHPDQQERVRHFCQAAIYFYEKEYDACLELVNQRPFTGRFYYCDMKTLLMRTIYEQDDLDLYYEEIIPGIIKTINNDPDFKPLHKQMYLHFFSLLKQLFRLRNETGRKQEKLERLEQLEAHIVATHPLAQKKWLLEKVEELQGQKF